MRSAVFLFSCVSLASCASIPASETPPQGKQISLPAQTLDPGDCGLFIWTADIDRHFILFSQAKTQTGVWYSGKNTENLSIQTQAGTPANEQFPATTYVASSGTKLSVNLRRREAIIDGTRFKSGTLKVSDPDSWERVTPIVGLSACQAR